MREPSTVFVAGASGFVGDRLLPALVAGGHAVRAGSRVPRRGAPGISWALCDLESRRSLAAAMAGCGAAFFLVHGLDRPGDYGAWERAGAQRFRRAAERAGVARLVYLGGLAPAGPASRHLRSRLEVGEVLRAGRVPCVELRSSMLIGRGSASWQIARDLALRLPLLPVPPWARSVTEPLDVSDAVAALVAALDPRVPAPSILDLPGPEPLPVIDLVCRIAAARGIRARAYEASKVGTEVSAAYLRFLTGADPSVVRELVLGLQGDVLARDASAWRVLGRGPLVPLDEAIRRALAEEPEDASFARRWERWLAKWLIAGRGSAS